MICYTGAATNIGVGLALLSGWYGFCLGFGCGLAAMVKLKTNTPSDQINTPVDLRCHAKQHDTQNIQCVSSTDTPGRKGKIPRAMVVQTMPLTCDSKGGHPTTTFPLERVLIGRPPHLGDQYHVTKTNSSAQCPPTTNPTIIETSYRDFCWKWVNYPSQTRMYWSISCSWLLRNNNACRGAVFQHLLNSGPLWWGQSIEGRQPG